MTTPIRKTRPKQKEIAVIHVCTQEEQIKKMNLILLGNGNPKDGYVYKVMEMGDSVKSIGKDISEIKTKLSGVSEVNTELEVQRRVSVEIEKIKDKGDEKNIKNKALSWQSVGVVVAILMLITSITIGIINLVHTSEIPGIKNEIDYLQSPIQNSRGETVFWPSLLPADSLKVVPDSLKR
jgi:hypothetical protein